MPDRLKNDTVNFWNPNKQPKLISETEISWETVTTGGASAVDLWVDSFSGADNLFIDTNQGNMTIDANKIDKTGVTQECGGYGHTTECSASAKEI